MNSLSLSGKGFILSLLALYSAFSKRQWFNIKGTVSIESEEVGNQRAKEGVTVLILTSRYSMLTAKGKARRGGQNPTPIHGKKK